ncbi:cyclin-dependent kinase 4-like [Odontomachus brunneus]|uniref:cyclin-dependent kinase 4-like n=1 Tax=Odontomachus brunneus TaxID=486640 RepID=UPI0013F26BE5|nr:cyclin-dependent kinase 4-like [Odontomachus brunneus]XP_032675545.1 cyclin-dependent kinase 4-like [Odontomachus brunneus]XP_032675546.1 cyclin-dependent kinase 4-like [Odontomachus brunneus]XP_032675547.1 cyclin-dependent kinase 4-like [Odontomachus brunneus]XP_032675549.1 cyclin-dependent kinase 4-like [Odontomachus brunneus]XP_032675550.1 cyclin-dependent kinase 4-like [Odontomachus brunneus]XP_032675551.1 cyclin-dependent kinase 4-like [Odontomachus brunneus]XP_032675552.1 cyclin-dep
MAGRSRRSSTELEPDLSTPTAAKKSKQSETLSEELPAEEDLTKLEIIESPSTSEISSRTEIVQKRSEQLGEIAEPAEASKQSSLAGETSLGSAETSVELFEQKTDATATSAEATPGSSKEEQLGTLKSIVMKYGNQRELSDASGKTPETTVQIQTFLLGEHASYEELSLIGNGAYGTVYKAKDKVSGQIVALKKVRVPLTEDGLPMSTLREIATLKQLERFEHPHIVKLLDVCQGSYLDLPSSERSGRLDRGLTLWLVFEHVERDLASYIANCPPTGIPPYLVRQMSKEILCGVEFLHSHRIIHRDLKPQNLLVTRDGRIKIADFGLAKTYDFEMRLTSVVVTQWYRAPEVLLGCSYATPVDIWSVGCIMAELYKLEPLFPGTSEGDQLDRIFQVVGTPSQQAWPENVSLSWTAFPHRQPKPLSAIIPDLDEHGLDLVKNMLMFDPHSRITAAQAVRHRYFSEDDA